MLLQVGQALSGHWSSTSIEGCISASWLATPVAHILPFPAGADERCREIATKQDDQQPVKRVKRTVYAIVHSASRY
jgi:hypothetical protein